MLLANKISTFPRLAYRAYRRSYHVCVVGGANEVGQTVSLLLRAQPSVTKLSIHDIQEQTPGVVLDLAHIPVESCLNGYTGEETLDRALMSADIVVATGGTLKRPGVSEESWFTTNSQFMMNVATKVARAHPVPFFAIVTEPINVLVPMAAELLRNYGECDPKKLFGVTTVDMLTAQSLYAIEHKLNARDCIVPVIGGHSENSMVPLLSQSKPALQMDTKTIQEYTTKVRKACDMVMCAKRGWSPSLSVAYGALLFVRSVIDALDGRPAKVNAFILNNDYGTGYFSGQVSLDRCGVVAMDKYEKLSEYELYLLNKSIEEIRKDVLRGKKVLELA